MPREALPRRQPADRGGVGWNLPLGRVEDARPGGIELLVVKPAHPLRRGRSGRRAARGRAAWAATTPSGRAARSSTGTSSSRTSAASSRTATPRITPISFGGSGPESANVKKTATITAAAAKIDAAGVRDAADHRLACGSRAAVPVLLGAREQEHGVVHRDREDHREEEHRSPGVEEALRLEAEQAREVAVLEDQPGDAERGAGGQQVREHADGGDDRRLQRDEQQQEAEAEDDADDQRRLGRQQLLEVVVLGDRAADQRAGGQRRSRSRSIVAPTALDDGSASGSPARARRRRHPGPRGMTWAMPGSALATAATRCGVALCARRSGARPARPGRTPAGPACSRCASCRRSGRP